MSYILYYLQEADRTLCVCACAMKKVFQEDPGVGEIKNTSLGTSLAKSYSKVIPIKIECIDTKK